MTMQLTRRLAVVLAGTLMVPATASAQPSETSEPSKAAESPGAEASAAEAKAADGRPTDKAIEEARDRYERGLRLYEDGAYDAARIEFERAYAVAPTYKLLYNIGIVYSQLGDFVKATQSLDSYLAEGGDEIAASRRSEVERLLSELRRRIANVTVSVNTDADVFVDDVLVGHAPLTAPVPINPGRRRISASKRGWSTATKTVDIGSSDHVTVDLELIESKTTIVMSDRSRRVPWVGWITTGALAVGAGAFGYFALNSSSNLEDARAQRDADPDKLDSDASRTRVYSIVADSLAAGAVVAGAVSLYLTIKWGKDSGSEAPSVGKLAPPREIKVAPGFGGMSVHGTF